MRIQESQIDIRYHIVDTLEELKRIKTAFPGSTAVCRETGTLYEYVTFANPSDIYEANPDFVYHLAYYYAVSNTNTTTEGNVTTLYTLVPGVSGDPVAAGTVLYTDKNCTIPSAEDPTQYTYTGETDANKYDKGCWVTVTGFSSNVLTYIFNTANWQLIIGEMRYKLNLPVIFPIGTVDVCFYDTDNKKVYADNIQYVKTNNKITNVYAYVPVDPDCRFSGTALITFNRIVA